MAAGDHTAGDTRPIFTANIGAGWGLHVGDVNLAWGNLTDVVCAPSPRRTSSSAESRAVRGGAHPPPGREPAPRQASTITLLGLPKLPELHQLLVRGEEPEPRSETERGP